MHDDPYDHTENPISSLDDARLAAQARTDPQAFAELYRRHVRSIYRYHLAHTGNVKDAEDLPSQTFMAALEGIRSFRGRSVYHLADRDRLTEARYNSCLSPKKETSYATNLSS
jgi:hypothetical protein